MNGGRVTLRDVVGAKLIEVPTELRTEYRGQKFTAQLQVDGTIHFGGLVFTAPSMALGAARNIVEGRPISDRPRPTGGWPYWLYFDEPGQRWLPLDAARKKYLEGSRP